MAVWPSDEDSVERSRFPAVAAGRPIFLIWSSADRTLLVFGLRDGSETVGTGERTLTLAAEAMEREETVSQPSNERG